MSTTRLAVVATHPVQYTAPVFRRIAADPSIEFRAFYTWSQTESGGFFDRQFGRRVEWDVPLLEGYEYRFVENVSRQPGNDRFFGIRAPSLVREIRDWRPDAILVYGWNNSAHLQVLRSFKGQVPVFFRGDATLLDPLSPQRRRLRRTLLRWVYRHVDVAICVGQCSHEYFEWCGLPPESIEFAPHSVDVVRFESQEREQEAVANEWRRELGIGQDEFVCLFAGKLIPKKGPLLLLRAFLEAGIAGHLVYCGNGELESELRTAARGSDHVHFMPFQNQSRMPAVYRLGDVLALTSTGPGETWGLVLNEAMACGRPVIASTRAGATRDLVVDDATGWSFDPGEDNALTRRLVEAKGSGRERLRDLGASARMHIQGWSLEESARRIIAAVVRRVATVGP